MKSASVVHGSCWSSEGGWRRGGTTHIRPSAKQHWGTGRLQHVPPLSSPPGTWWNTHVADALTYVSYHDLIKLPLFSSSHSQDNVYFGTAI